MEPRFDDFVESVGVLGERLEFIPLSEVLEGEVWCWKFPDPLWGCNIKEMSEEASKLLINYRRLFAIKF